MRWYISARVGVTQLRSQHHATAYAPWWQLIILPVELNICVPQITTFISCWLSAVVNYSKSSWQLIRYIYFAACQPCLCLSDSVYVLNAFPILFIKFIYILEIFVDSIWILIFCQIHKIIWLMYKNIEHEPSFWNHLTQREVERN